MYHKQRITVTVSVLPLQKRKTLLNYLKRVDQHSVGNFKKTLFADKNFYSDPFGKEILINIMIEGLSNNRNQRTENEQELYNEYNKVKDQLEELKIKSSELETQVNFFQTYY